MLAKAQIPEWQEFTCSTAKPSDLVRQLTPSQDHVHRPTPTGVLPWAPEVLQDILVRAAGLLQGIRQDREAFGVELAAGDIAFLVGCLGDGDNGTGEPVRGGGGVEGEAPKEATQE